MIVEQFAPTGPTAWLAAVGLAHLSKDIPVDPVEYYLQASEGRVLSRPSRWENIDGTWMLEIDQPASFADLIAWFDGHFDGDHCGIQFLGRDPWWRTRGNTSPSRIGAALHRELAAVSRPVDLIAELGRAAGILRTEAAAGWVVDRQWVTLERGVRQMERPLIRYALAFIGATVAQHWPGHMVGIRAVGHLWDGQPGDHPLTEQTAITWEPDPDEGPGGNKYPAWWGRGAYVTIPAATWPMMVQDRWEGEWLAHELVGRTTASRILPHLPNPHLSRSRVPLWRRSILERQTPSTAEPPEDAGDQPAADEPTPKPPARSATSAAPVIGDVPLDIAGVAEKTSLSKASIRTYLHNGSMPPNDGKMGQSLWWWSSTIDIWQQTRPTSGRPTTKTAHTD